jgi:hypothetical protein
MPFMMLIAPLSRKDRSSHSPSAFTAPRVISASRASIFFVWLSVNSTAEFPAQTSNFFAGVLTAVISAARTVSTGMSDMGYKSL